MLTRFWTAVRPIRYAPCPFSGCPDTKGFTYLILPKEPKLDRSLLIIYQLSPILMKNVARTTLIGACVN